MNRVESLEPLPLEFIKAMDARWEQILAHGDHQAVLAELEFQLRHQPEWWRSVCFWEGVLYKNTCPICRGEHLRYLPGENDWCKTWQHPEYRDPTQER